MPASVQSVSVAHHHSKNIVTDKDGHLEYEVDNYYSGRTFPDPDPDSQPGSVQPEWLWIKYNYDTQGGEKSRWECRYIGPENPSKAISLSEGETLLMQWGLKRLNY